MPNVLPTPVIIADKMLEFLFETSGVINDVNRDYESEFAMDANSIGRVVQVKNPPRFAAQDGPAITSIQSTNFGLTPFSIDQWKTIPIELTGLEKTFNNAKELDLWAEKNIKPLVAPLVAAIETSIFGLYNKVANHVGTPNTGPTTIDPLAQAMEKMAFFETPQDERVCYLNPTGARKFLGGTVVFSNSGGAFNPQEQLGRMFTSGRIMPSVAGFSMRESNKVANHTSGSVTSTGANVLVNGAFTGSSMAVDAFTTGKTLKKGDVITIGVIGTSTAVMAVNPVTKKSTGQLRQFVVTEDVTAAGNAATVTISPPVIPSGSFQNVTGATADLTAVPDNAEVVRITSAVSTTYAQNLAWWKKAIGLVTVPISPLEGAVKSVTRTYDGISLTFTSGADIMNFKTIKRVDLAFGVDIFNAYQDQIVRITN
jgi:hypothetical protein